MDQIDYNNISFMAARRPAVDLPTKRVRAIFSVLAWVAAIGGGILAYRWMSSWTLAIFVAFLAIHIFGRGIPDVITDPKKIQRTFFFGLYPAICTGLLYLTYQWTDRMWLAVLLALVLGTFLNGIVGKLLFPEIFREELEDGRQRMKESW